MTESRSPETTSCTVRAPNSSRSAPEMVWRSRRVASASEPCTETKYWRTSTMRQRMNESTSTGRLPEVRKRSGSASS